MEVKVPGQFINGTYVRVGNTFYQQGSPGFTFEPKLIRFTAPAADLLKDKPQLVSRDGSEVPLVDPADPEPRPFLNQSCSEEKPSEKVTPPKLDRENCGPVNTQTAVSTLDLATSLLTVFVKDMPTEPALNKYLIYIAGHVFGLPMPDSFDQSSSMWVDEAIWGHRPYDEQSPWMVFLEFLNVFHHELGKNRAFDEPNGLNTLKYQAAQRLHLRNILFNDPHLGQVRSEYAHDTNRWDEWLKRMKAAIGIAHPEFGYVRDHFHSYEDFAEVVALIRSSSIEVNSNKRWTSKFVFPYGKHSLYEDLDNNASTNDRRFFGRTGELLYLMCCRAGTKKELLSALQKCFARTDPAWDTIVKSLQPDDESYSRDRANPNRRWSAHK